MSSLKFRFWILVVFAAPGLMVPRAVAADGAAGNASLESAEQALAMHLPEVAIQKLNGFLTSSGALDDALLERAEEDLTQAMMDSDDAVGALARLEFPSTDIQKFWKAEVLSAMGRWDDAAPLYQDVAANGPANLREAATLGEAEALHAMGRGDEARALLAKLETKRPSTLVALRLAELYLENQQIQPAAKLLAKATPANPLEAHWRQYVEGRLYLAEDQPAPALNDFDELLADTHGLTAALHAGATVGSTEARIALNGLEVADNVIENFIWSNPNSPYLEEMFRRLDAIYAAESTPSDSEFKHWAATAPPRRAALALYYEGRSLQHQGSQREKAIRAYTDFVHRFPNHPFVYDAWMQLGYLYLGDGHGAVATSCFEAAMRDSSTPDERARAEIASGNVDFAQGDFLHATETFHDAADRSTDPELWKVATYDSALAWLHLRNYDRFLQDYSALSQRDPETDERRNLLLEEGLLQANLGDPRAGATLRSFIHDFPDNRRVAEAQIALAELVYADGNADSASNLLKAAYVSSPSPQSKEQADYLAIFLADSSSKRSDEEVLKLGRQFLDSYPNSTLRPQVRMKMGELYFRREDFANAQTQFETLAEEAPGDALADKALILAGQSAVNGMSADGIQHALGLFDRVANGTGPLRLYARQEEALLKVRQGDEKAAIIIYDDILRSNPDTPLRLAALCGKADCLVALAAEASPTPSASPSPAVGTAAANDPSDAYTAATALYDQVATDPDATAPWRDQALYKKGRCLAKQGFADQALTAYYDVLNTRPSAGKQQPDFFWYEKAGYDAAAMLEAKSQWPGAIAMLEKVAQAGGPRSAEAKHLADQLRLEHFVWD